jgi:hypothetical protein
MSAAGAAAQAPAPVAKAPAVMFEIKNLELRQKGPGNEAELVEFARTSIMQTMSWDSEYLSELRKPGNVWFALYEKAKLKGLAQFKNIDNKSFEIHWTAINADDIALYKSFYKLLLEKAKECARTSEGVSLSCYFNNRTETKWLNAVKSYLEETSTVYVHSVIPRSWGEQTKITAYIGQEMSHSNPSGTSSSSSATSAAAAHAPAVAVAKVAAPLPEEKVYRLEQKTNIRNSSHTYIQPSTIILKTMGWGFSNDYFTALYDSGNTWFALYEKADLRGLSQFIKINNESFEIKWTGINAYDVALYKSFYKLLLEKASEYARTSGAASLSCTFKNGVDRNWHNTVVSYLTETSTPFEAVPIPDSSGGQTKIIAYIGQVMSHSNPRGALQQSSSSSSSSATAAAAAQPPVADMAKIAASLPKEENYRLEKKDNSSGKYHQASLSIIETMNWNADQKEYLETLNKPNNLWYCIYHNTEIKGMAQFEVYKNGSSGCHWTGIVGTGYRVQNKLLFQEFYKLLLRQAGEIGANHPDQDFGKVSLTSYFNAQKESEWISAVQQSLNDSNTCYTREDIRRTWGMQVKITAYPFK